MKLPGSALTEASMQRVAVECARRRAVLMRKLGQSALAVVVAAPTARRSRDVDHPYRPDSNLVYLTGFCEPDAIAVFAPGRSDGEYILFCAPRDRQREVWEGAHAGLEGAVRDYRADQAFPIGDFKKFFPQIAAGYASVYLPVGKGSSVPQNRLIDYLRCLDGQPPRTLIAVERLLHEMRLRKSRAEIAWMKTASMISVAAHRRAMQVCRPGVYEYQLAAEFDYAFQRERAVCAYPSIVGGGANGCVLHYTSNCAPLRRDELVLIDAGAEYQGYASDVTRTFPVSGRFSEAQREVYAIVLEAQREALKKVCPGNTWADVHATAVRALTKGLVSLGLLEGRLPTLIKRGEYRRFYMHRTGHWLGMDVHDVGDYRSGNEWRRFQPGMALTVEPGLYIRPGPGVARRWRNIGIRIEDSVVVTKEGAYVLSDGAPKEIDAVEALCAA